MKLYELAQEYETILNDLYTEEGEINQTALQRLDENKAAVEEKAIAVASFIQNMDAEYHAIEEAKQRMADREKRYKRKIEDLKGYLLFNMEKRGINHIKCPYFEIRLKKCPPSVNVLEEKDIPEEYFRIKTETLLDKAKMLSELKNGVVIPGASLQQRLTIDIK